MADIKWIKIVTDIFDNRKIRQIEKLPEADAILIIWFKLLCLAGDINENGLIIMTKDIPYTDEMLANEFHKPITIVRLALDIFVKFEMIEIINNIYCVSNWEKYQNIDGMEKVREQTRRRVAEHRKKQKLLALGECNVTSNVTVTQCNATDIDKDIDIDINNINNINNIKEKINKKEKSFQDVFDENNFSDELLKTLKYFIDMRKTIKKPMTTRALELLIGNLNKLSDLEEEKIAILNQSIEHGWQTVYPLKDEIEKNKYIKIKQENKEKNHDEISYSMDILTKEEQLRLYRKEMPYEELKRIVKERMGE